MSDTNSLVKTEKNKSKLLKFGIAVMSLYSLGSMQLHVTEVNNNDGFLLGKYTVSVSMATAEAQCGMGMGCSGGGGQCGMGMGCGGQ
jgi:hypothetical protein